jgi:hypothetical protein
MSDMRERKADSYFSCSDSERAAFEAGIKLGTIFHQYVGVPLSPGSVETLERAIEAASRVQPFVEDVRVAIDRSKLREKKGEYDYVALTGDMLDVRLVIRFKETRLRANMRFMKDINYPLMYIDSVERV